MILPVETSVGRYVGTYIGGSHCGDDENYTHTKYTQLGIKYRIYPHGVYTERGPDRTLCALRVPFCILAADSISNRIPEVGYNHIRALHSS